MGDHTVPKDKLLEKLRSLNCTQQSIESTSGFLVFYRKDARNVVAIWESEYSKVPVERKLVLLYLANHVLQESRKKGRDFIDEFFRVMPRALKALLKNADDKTRKAVTRLVDIWEERHVFNSTCMKSIRDGMSGYVEKSSRSSLDTNTEDRKKLQAVQSLADALAEVDAAAQQCEQMSTMAIPFFKQDLLTTAPTQEVASALEVFAKWGKALKTELEARQRAEDLLQKMLASQQESLARVEESLNLCTIQQENTQKRYTELTSMGIAAGFAALTQANFAGMPQFLQHQPQQVQHMQLQQPQPTVVHQSMAMQAQPSYQHQVKYEPPMYEQYGQQHHGASSIAAMNEPDIYHPATSMPTKQEAGQNGSLMSTMDIPSEAMPGVMASDDMGYGGTFSEEGSPQAPQPENSPQAPAMDDTLEQDTAGAMDDMPGLADQLANSDASAQLLAQALEQLPPEERDKFGLNIAEVLMNLPAGLNLDLQGIDLGAAGMDLGAAAGMDLGAADLGGGDDDQYDPENPE